MSIKIEKTIGKVRIYEDGRIYFCFYTGVIWSMGLIAAMIMPQPSSDLALFGLGFGCLVVTYVVWAVISLNQHMSITLDATRRVLKFSRHWNLNIPSYIVPFEDIDRFEMLGHSISCLFVCVKRDKNAKKPLMEYSDSGALLLAFTMKVMNKYERRLLMNYQSGYEEGVEAAVLLGEFSNKPAFGNDGEQIFVPKN